MFCDYWWITQDEEAVEGAVEATPPGTPRPSISFQMMRSSTVRLSGPLLKRSGPKETHHWETLYTIQLVDSLQGSEFWGVVSDELLIHCMQGGFDGLRSLTMAKPSSPPPWLSQRLLRNLIPSSPFVSMNGSTRIEESYHNLMMDLSFSANKSTLIILCSSAHKLPPGAWHGFWQLRWFQVGISKGLIIFHKQIQGVSFFEKTWCLEKKETSFWHT